MRHISALWLAGSLLFGGVAYAHPGHEHSPDLRVWKDADGLFEIEASFVLVRDEKVKLCKHDGTLVWVPLEKLSIEDRLWVRKRVAEIVQLNGSLELQTAVESASVESGAEFSNTRAASPEMLGGSAVLLIAAIGLFARRKFSTVSCATLSLSMVGSLTALAAPEAQKAPPPIQQHFEPFKDKLELRFDDEYFYVGANAFPDHPMMIGIKSWQQQVPLPQPYNGKNAWQIPLKPRLAEKPISAKTALFSGAIAVAVNGVPIFNALNNRGEDAFLSGELDEYGGHCGRGDDYHYHVAPVHLQKVVGRENPIAYALDGFPIYGYLDADGKEPNDLDEFNGRSEKGGYRYYSSKKYPYINGGMRGVVTVRGDRIEPQPRDLPIRPAGRPLRGAKITDFLRDEDKKTYTVEYEFQGKTYSVKYIIGKDNTYTFTFKDGDGKETTETYVRRDRKDGPPPKKDGPPKKDK
jgi:hypothetical protein